VAQVSNLRSQDEILPRIPHRASSDR